MLLIADDNCLMEELMFVSHKYFIVAVYLVTYKCIRAHFNFPERKCWPHCSKKSSSLFCFILNFIYFRHTKVIYSKCEGEILHLMKQLFKTNNKHRRDAYPSYNSDDIVVIETEKKKCSPTLGWSPLHRPAAPLLPERAALWTQGGSWGDVLSQVG